MLLLGAFFALLTVSFWVRRTRRPRRTGRPTGPAAEAAFRRHPAGRALFTDAELADTELADADLATAQPPSVSRAVAGPQGPDDDPEFLSELDRLIRGRRQRDA
jgi:hypothetical protein